MYDKTDMEQSDTIFRILTRGVEEVIVQEHLENSLRKGTRLRVKFGIDPTAPNIHLGHSVPLRKLKQFQDAGHTIVLIIGDFTARIGDPSGRNDMRKPLSEKEIKENMKGYLKEAGLILDIKKAEIHYNSEWHEKKGLAHILSIAQSATIQQVLKRDDFKKRIENDSDISLLELFYPVLQGYDSVEVRADVEIGGTDQKFNLLMGRRVQRHFGMEEQDVLTVPLLEGTDGVKKMSKSVGNYIALTDEPNAMFGKIMAIPDTLLEKYYELLTDEKADISDPYASKIRLAEIITEMYQGKKKAEKAKEFFIDTFSKKEIPENVPEHILVHGAHATILEVIGDIRKEESKSELRRLIEQGGVSINGEKKMNPNELHTLKDGVIIKIGKKNFWKIRFK